MNTETNQVSTGGHEDRNLGHMNPTEIIEYQRLVMTAEESGSLPRVSLACWHCSAGEFDEYVSVGRMDAV
ncbi:MAG: hypothetical protein ACK58L_18535 [Planctomycetota bacterium]